MVEKIPYLILALLLSFLFGLTSCRTFPAGKITQGSLEKGKKQQGGDQKPLPSAQSMQIPIGIVHMVDQAGNFVLIKSTRNADLDPETQVIAYGPDATMSSHLKVSPARKGPYLTADLVDGMPSVGDMVMMVQTIHKPSPNGSAEEGPSLGKVQVLE